MTAPTFTRATKSSAKLRLALFGPSGAGKTFTALRLAKGIGGRVALVDTERGSASKYADRFEFDTLQLEDRTLAGYVQAVHAAAEYDVLIIDSLTHGWRELLAEVDKLARAKYSGNTWSAWSEGTPKQMAFIDALLQFPGHVIATMRSKTEWAIEKDEKSGRTKPVRIGLAPEEGKGIEYEFDLLLELSPDHIGTAIKDRSGKFQDVIVEKPGEEFGASLAAWVSRGAPPAPSAPPPPPPPPPAPAPAPSAAPPPAGEPPTGADAVAATKAKSETVTEFWQAVKDQGLSTDEGKRALAECSGDFEEALRRMQKAG